MQIVTFMNMGDLPRIRLTARERATFRAASELARKVREMLPKEMEDTQTDIELAEIQYQAGDLAESGEVKLW